ncbi:hypothetical protein DPMN_087938 [Dreissena polymorpha]|uniref:Uncharacterized protein n=1 Tax=Dreissena polymorpha TaxID=45954 RepID=A0A9D4QVZ2_DREPO|nr:hypothetical protein DPMN_087938 [Dreissena polymorpha]
MTACLINKATSRSSPIRSSSDDEGQLTFSLSAGEDARLEDGPILKPHLSNQQFSNLSEKSIKPMYVQEINKTNCSITRKTAPPPWRPYIYKTNLFTKFHDDWGKNVTSRVSHTKFHANWAKNVTFRVFKCFHYIHIEKNAPPIGDINKTYVLTNFHDDWAKIVTSRVFTRKTSPPTGGHANIFTKFHENWAKNVTSRVFTCFHYIHIKKNAPPTGGHVFLPIWTISNSSETSIKPIVYKENCPAHWQPFLQRTGTTFELNPDIIKKNILTNFELDRDFIGTKLLSKFHEDRTRNVASRAFTNKCEQTVDKDRSQKLT